MDIITYALCKKYVKKSLLGAGALIGQDGKSAYEVAVKNGFSGTEKQWIESLRGAPGHTPEIGENGNWWINGVDTFVPAAGIRSYNDLEDLPDIPKAVSELENDVGFITAGDVPTKTSELENDSNFITADDLPKNVSEFNNDTGYLTLNDISDFAKKTDVEELIPTKVSELENDLNFLTEHQKLKTINNESLVGEGNIEIDTCKVNDVLVNGESVVVDKIAYINNITSTMNRDFVTDITVGHLEAGTQINATDSIADILYRILFAQELPKKVNLYFGGSDDIPNSINDLDWKEEVLDVEPETLLTSTFKHIIKTGNLTTEDGQYPTLITTKAVKLVKLSRWNVEGAEAIDLNFQTIEKDNYYIYYIPTLNYDEDEGGKPYVFTFAEVD